MCKQKLAVRVILIVFVLAATSCSSSANKTGKGDIKMEPSVIEVSIGGMSCTGCEETIQNNVGKLKGIRSVKASYTAGNAIIEFFPDKVDTLKIKEAITGSGYAVKKFIIPNRE